MDEVDVRALIKYLCKKGMSHKEVHDDFIKNLGDESPSYSTVKTWAAESRRRRECVEVYERSGRPEDLTSEENVEFLHSLVMCDRRRTLCDIARQIGMFWGSLVYLDQYLKDGYGFSQMSPQNVDQTSEQEQA